MQQSKQLRGVLSSVLGLIRGGATHAIASKASDKPTSRY
jgi:hypothetical protein